MHESEKSKWSCSVVSNFQRPHGLQPTRLLRPWDFPGKSTGVGCHCFSKPVVSPCSSALLLTASCNSLYSMSDDLMTYIFIYSKNKFHVSIEMRCWSHMCDGESWALPESSECHSYRWCFNLCMLAHVGEPKTHPGSAQWVSCCVDCFWVKQA